MDVVSLLPSATEICFALGVEPVGVSHECDHPPAARQLPTVNRSYIDATASSPEINEQVIQAERHGGVYEIRLDLLVDLDPDLVVSQGVCEVCAVDTLLVEEALGEVGLDCEVLTTDPHSLGDVMGDIERIGGAIGQEQQADALVTRMQERIESVKSHARTAVDVRGRPRVAVLDWMDPVMVAGHWVPEMVVWAGGSYGLADAGARSRPREWQAIRNYDPEILAVAPCGFELDQTLENKRDIIDRPGWPELAAVSKGQVHAFDGHHYMNRPGPRLVDTLEYLAGVIHPDTFDTPPNEAVVALASQRA